jgi:hypothetical protein
LGEWWCLRDSSQVIDERETESALREADKLIDEWYRKWKYYIEDGLYPSELTSPSNILIFALEEGRGAKLDYLGRCSRFWINSYATKHLQTSSSGLNPVQKDQIRRCVLYASRVLDWPLDMSPFQKESLRFVSESSSIMVSFCCLYIVASCQTFGSSIPELFINLDKVVAAAQLMIDMSPDAEHNAHTQGLLILRRIEALRKKSSSHNENGIPNTGELIGGSDMAPRLAGHEPMNEVYDFHLNEEGMTAMDMIWDFSMLAPRTW